MLIKLSTIQSSGITEKDNVVTVVEGPVQLKIAIAHVLDRERW